MRFLSRHKKVRANYPNEVVIYSADLKSKLCERTGREIHYDGIDFIVQMTVNKDLAKVMEKEGASIVQQTMVDAANRSVDSSVQTLASLMAVFRKKVQRAPVRMESNGEFTALIQAENELRANCNTVIRTLMRELEQIPQRQWDQFAKSRTEYRKYQAKSGAKLAAGATGVGVSVGALAGSGATGGATLALGIIALQRSIVALYSEVKSLSQTAEQVLDALIKDIISLNQSYGKSNGRVRLGAREFASSAMRSVTGGLGGGIASGSRMREKVSLLKDKKNGLLTNCFTLSRELNKQLDSLQRMRAKYIDKELSQAQSRRLQYYFDKAGDKTMMLISFTSDYYSRWSNVGRLLNYLEPNIAFLNENNPKGAAVAGRFMEMLTSLGLSGASGGIDIKSANTAFEQAKDISLLIKDVGIEAISAGMDIRDAINENGPRSTSMA